MVGGVVVVSAVLSGSWLVMVSVIVGSVVVT